MLALHWGKEEKESASEASRAVVWGGERVRPPVRQSGCSSSFARRFFFFLCRLAPFLAFFPPGGACSQARHMLACKQALHLGDIVRSRRARGDAKAGVALHAACFARPTKRACSQARHMLMTSSALS